MRQNKCDGIPNKVLKEAHHAFDVLVPSPQARFL